MEFACSQRVTLHIHSKPFFSNVCTNYSLQEASSLNVVLLVTKSGTSFSPAIRQKKARSDQDKEDVHVFMTMHRGQSSTRLKWDAEIVAQRYTFTKSAPKCHCIVSAIERNAGAAIFCDMKGVLNCNFIHSSLPLIIMCTLHHMTR